MLWWGAPRFCSRSSAIHITQEPATSRHQRSLATRTSASNSLKKAATLLGVGLQPCTPEEAPPAPPPGPKLVPSVPEGEEPGVPDTNRLTRKQAEFIAKLARTNGLGKGEVEELARKRYGKSASFLTVKEASDFIKLLSSAA